MNMVGKVICRTVGTVGMGMALCDAWRVSNHYAKIGAGAANGKHLTEAYYNSRTIDKVSYANKTISEKVFDLRAKNPLPAIFGRIKGRTAGFLYGIGNFLPTIILSSLALTCKNWGARIGAIGIAAGICYNILHEGFGLGKKNPMV